MPKNKSFLILLLLTFALSLITACGERGESDPPDLIPVTIELKWKHQFQFAGYYAAVENGYFEEAGLEVTLIEPSENSDVVQNVLNGDVDFGIGASDLLISRAEGEPIIVLAALFQHSPLVFLVREDSGIRTVHDLVGKRVMIEPFTDELTAYLHDEGISKDQLILYPHTYDISRLISGEIDAMSAYVTDEPFLLEEAGIEYIVLSPNTGGIDFYGDILFTSEAFLRENPEIVQGFLVASKEGWSYAFNNVDELIDIIYQKYSTRHSRLHLSYEAEKMHQYAIPSVVEFGYMNLGRWQYIAEKYTELGMLEDDVSLGNFVYSGARTSNSELIKIIIGGILAVLAIFLLIGFSQIFSFISVQCTRVYDKLSKRK